MAKKVLILSGSPRVSGNSDILCDEFKKGALEAGNEVEKINFAKMKIEYCKGCYYCMKNNGKCAIQDDMGEILQKIIDSDVIVMASPVYFYSICAQLKALIDRTLARWQEVKDKDFYFIVTCADSAEGLNQTIECFRAYMTCVENARECGIIYGHDVYEKGEVLDKPAMKEAYEMGKSIF